MSKFKNIKISVLDTVPVLEGRELKESFDNMVDLARFVENLGYNRYWLAEHHNMPGIASSATSVVIGRVAEATKTIRVGSGGIMLPNHAPLVIAEQFGTLEAMYPNRIDLGLGRAPGSDQYTSMALRGDYRNKGQNFPDEVEELIRYLEGGEDHKVHATPGEGLNIPLWLLGSSDFSAKLAAKMGLPFSFASHFASSNAKIAIEEYRKNFKPSKYLSEPYVMLGVNIFAADTTEEAEYISTSHMQQFVGLMRNKPTKLKPPVKDMDYIWNEYEKMSLTNQMKGGSFIGNKEEIKVQLEAFLDIFEVDEIIINASIYDHKARLRSYEIISEIIKENK